LGVGRDATTEEVRDAYRRRARELHPDAPGGDATAMARLNAAYAVLGSPASRRDYDRMPPPPPAAPPPPAPAYDAPTAAPPTAPPVVDDRARFPWRTSLLAAAIGAIAVFVVATLREDPAPPPPDNLLEPGSCVEVVDGGTAVSEVTCDDLATLTVESIVGFDEDCPAGTTGYRDRQGLGRACVAPLP